jgi:hypothetical protein
MRAPARRRAAGLGVPLGFLLVLAIVVPGLTQEEPEDSEDPGRDMALAAGCDMSKNEVAMEVASLDYLRDSGSATVEEAVLGMRGYLEQNGLSVSEEELQKAAEAAQVRASAQGNAGAVEARLPGASLLVVPNGDAFVVGEVIICA